MSVWVTKPIAEIAEKIAMGPFGSNIKVSTFVDQGIPIISGQHLHGTRLDESSGFNFITDEHAEKLKNSNVFPGDIVFTHAGTIGQVSLIPETASFRRYIISQRQFYLRVDRRQADPAFVTRWFHAPVGKHRLMMHASQVGVPSISRPASNLKEIQIDLPPLGEQQAISEILDIIDDKIELNRRMAATMEEMARALYRSWFVDFDPVKAKAEGLAPAFMDEATAALFPDRFGDDGLPEGWRRGALIDLSSLNPEKWGTRNAPDVVVYVDLSNTKWGVVEATTTYSWTEAPSRARMVLRPGDTIVGTVRPGNGSYAYIAEAGLTGSTGFAVLRPNRSNDAALVNLAATDADNIASLTNLADGGAYPAVRPEVVGSSEVVIAAETVRDAFAARVTPIVNRIEEVKRESRSLAELRDALLPKLMSGEIRVGTIENQIEAVA